MQKVDLRFGLATHWELDFEGQLRRWDGCPLPVPADLTAQLRNALANPLDFPSIEQAIVPGDRVAILVDPLLPQMVELVSACISYLLEHGVQAEQLVVVLASHEPEDAMELRNALTQVAGEEIPIELHDADDQNKVAYVAANEESNPIYMNRTIVDADVVLPITCARGHSTLDYMGAYSVFPLLTDRATRGEFYSLEKLDVADEHAKLTAWADQAAWWVGLLVVVQAVPAARLGISTIIAGTPTAVESAVQPLMESGWQVTEEPTDVIVAMLEGGPSQQTWENFARVLHTARQLVARGGSIVLCTELSKRPGRGLHKLQNVHSSTDMIAKKLAHDAADDALAAAVILEATRHCHVYLISALKPESVESLGMGPIQDASQLEHLLSQHNNCTLLGAAQHRFVGT
jgi:nickel-dependent lactate racemase